MHSKHFIHRAISQCQLFFKSFVEFTRKPKHSGLFSRGRLLTVASILLLWICLLCLCPHFNLGRSYMPRNSFVSSRSDYKFLKYFLMIVIAVCYNLPFNIYFINLDLLFFFFSRSDRSLSVSLIFLRNQFFV